MPGIFTTERLGDPWLKFLMAGCLKAGTAAVSHRSAGALWQLDGMRRDALEITIPFAAGSLQLSGFTVHRTRTMLAADLTNQSRLPVTKLERTLIDLASVLTNPELEAALDSALRKRQTNLARLRARLDLQRARGVQGIAELTKLVDERRGGNSSLGSPLEAKFLAIVRRAKLPEPQRQVWIKDGQRCIARVDFAYPSVKLAIEIDSIEHHFGRRAMQRDRRRDNELSRLGWTILRFTAADLEEDDYVVSELRTRLTPDLFL